MVKIMDLKGKNYTKGTLKNSLSILVTQDSSNPAGLVGAGKAAENSYINGNQPADLTSPWVYDTDINGGKAHLGETGIISIDFYSDQTDSAEKITKNFFLLDTYPYPNNDILLETYSYNNINRLFEKEFHKLKGYSEDAEEDNAESETLIKLVEKIHDVKTEDISNLINLFENEKAH